MLYDSIYFSGLGVQLGHQVRTPHLVRRVMVAAETVSQTRQRSVCVASGVDSSGLATAAVRRALRCHELETGSPSALSTPAGPAYHGDELTASGGFRSRVVVDRFGELDCSAVDGFSWMTNGLLLGAQLAATLMVKQGDVENALVFTGSHFGGVGSTRVNAIYGALQGDAGAAVVLGRLGGLAQLVSSETIISGGVRKLDEVAGGSATGASFPPKESADVAALSRACVDDACAPERHLRAHRDSVREAVARALDDADLGIGAVRWVLCPFVGHQAVADWWLEPLGITADRTLTELGSYLGHLGAADPVVGLAHLLATGQLDAGDHVLLVASGVSVSFTATVLRICDSTWPTVDLFAALAADTSAEQPCSALVAP